MKSGFRRLAGHVKRDPILWISEFLAVISFFAAGFDVSFVKYIDIRTLVLLFSLMSVVAGFTTEGVFGRIAGVFVKRAENCRTMGISLVMMCFFSSMFITNDVALITLVPLCIMIMHKRWPEHMMFVIIMQTVAANLGSMIMPFGNPQNLYLFSYYEMGFVEFLKVVLPSGIAGLGLIIILMMRLPGVAGGVGNAYAEKKQNQSFDGAKTAVYCVLFLLCILAVLRVMPYGIVGTAVLAVMLVTDRRVLKRVDYGLLITFVFFFVFVGNIGSMEAVSGWLEYIIKGRAVLVSVLASQVISNVPAAVLLSGFTADGAGLVLGTDLGGLGTLIASMASIISLRLYMKCEGADFVRYVFWFLVINFVLLGILMLFVMQVYNLSGM